MKKGCTPMKVQFEYPIKQLESEKELCQCKNMQ